MVTSPKRVKRSSGQNALACLNSSFQTRSVVTKFFPKMVLQFSSSKASEHIRPMSKRLQQGRGIKNAKTDAFPTMVTRFSTSKASDLMKPNSRKLEQEKCITNAKTDAYYQKMVLTYSITFCVGIAVFLVLGFLINVTLLDEDEDLIFLRILIIFLNIIWSILVMCFYWYMGVKLQNLEERRAAEMKEEKKILTKIPKKSSIKTGYGTIGKIERV